MIEEVLRSDRFLSVPGDLKKILQALSGCKFCQHSNKIDINNLTLKECLELEKKLKDFTSNLIANHPDYIQRFLFSYLKEDEFENCYENFPYLKDIMAIHDNVNLLGDKEPSIQIKNFDREISFMPIRYHHLTPLDVQLFNDEFDIKKFNKECPTQSLQIAAPYSHAGQFLSYAVEHTRSLLHDEKKTVIQTFGLWLNNLNGLSNVQKINLYFACKLLLFH